MDSHLESESARLIPEEKKEFKPAQPTPNFPRGGMSFTESAYKEFDPLSNEQFNSPENQNRDNAIVGFRRVESSEPQEKAPCQHMYQGPDNDGITRCIWCRDPHEISAPSGSQEEQEELWKEARHYIDVWRIEELFKRFTITRKPE